MVVHTFAYYSNVSPGAYTELNVVQDDVLTRTAATRFMVPAAQNRIIWGFVLGTNLQDIYLSTPSLITKKYFARIIPRIPNQLKLPLDGNYLYVPTPPLALTATEELSVLAKTGGTSASPVYTVLTFSPETLPPPPGGEPIMVRATGSTTLVANQWSTVKLTPDIQLEAGTYALLGAIGISANAIAIRFIIPGMVWRPGFPALAGAEDAVVAFANDYFAGLPSTEYGRFSHLALPEVQFLSTSADSAEVVYLKIVKVA